MKFELMLRLLVLVLLGTIFLISGLYRKRDSNLEFTQKQEDGGMTLALRMAAAIPLFLVIILNIFFPEWIGWSKLNLPGWLRITGLALALISVLWLWWVFFTLGSTASETVLPEESQELITTGPYGFVRHPLYAGGLLFLFSIGLVFADWVILIFALAGFLAFRFLVIPAEEESLLAAFGEDYETYRRRTGTMLPWIR